MGDKKDLEKMMDHMMEKGFDIGDRIQEVVSKSVNQINGFAAEYRKDYQTDKMDEVYPDMRAEEERKAVEAMMKEEEQRKKEKKEKEKKDDNAKFWKIFGMFMLLFLFLRVGVPILKVILALGLTTIGVGLVLAFNPVVWLIAFLVIHNKNKKKQKGSAAYIKRFAPYLELFRGQVYFSIDDICKRLGYSRKKVLRDLHEMIESGAYAEGHIDADEKYFMMTNEVYEQYLHAQASYAEQKEQEARMTRKERKEAKERKEREEVRRKEEETLRSIDQQKQAELKTALERGIEYSRKIRDYNDQIPGEEISAKLDHMETLAKQIFTIVGNHPEKLPEIQKFMDYYLPTTLKLLANYAEFNSQPVQGDNIINAKKEIEETLDMINLAFENLSNRLYEETAMEVSADITVLQSLLEQEGLGKKDFVLK